MCPKWRRFWCVFLCVGLLVDNGACVFLFAQGYVLGRLVGRIKGSLATTTKLGSPYVLGKYVIKKAVALNMMRRGVLIGLVGKPFIDAAVMKKGLEAQAALLMLRRRPLAFLLNPFLRRRESEDKDKGIKFIHTKDDVTSSSSSYYDKKNDKLPLKMPTFHITPGQISTSTSKPSYFATPPTPIPYRQGAPNYYATTPAPRQTYSHQQITYFPTDTTPKGIYPNKTPHTVRYSQTSYYTTTVPYQYQQVRYQTTTPVPYKYHQVQNNYQTTTQMPYKYSSFNFITTPAPTRDGPIFAGIEINFG